MLRHLLRLSSAHLEGAGKPAAEKRGNPLERIARVGGYYLLGLNYFRHQNKKKVQKTRHVSQVTRFIPIKITY